MESENQIEVKIQNNIRELARIIHDISIKYKQEPLVKDLQNQFLCLSVNVGIALDFPLQ
jgi:hypothetical protein